VTQLALFPERWRVVASTVTAINAGENVRQSDERIV
jgi:hypothetical protein